MLNINENILLNRVGDYSTYIRGKSYYSEGRVVEIRSNLEKDYFESIVRGSSNYQVSIRFHLGAQYKYYNADISRTFPVNGKFTERQKQVYNVVLKALNAVEEAAKPGVPYKELNEITKKH